MNDASSTSEIRTDCESRSPSRRLRCAMLTLLACLLVSQSGCQIFQRFRRDKEIAPVVFKQPPTQQQLFATLNSNSQKIKQLKTNVKISMAGLPTSLKGSLIVERPNRLRLKAGLMGVSEMGVDVGSNDQAFWIFSKASIGKQKPALMYASHTDYERSPIKASIPLEPSWLIDALGLVEFSPNDTHRGPFLHSNGGMYVFHTYRNKPTGQEVRETVVNKSGLIVQQSIYHHHDKAQDPRLVAYATSTQHKYYPDPGVSLPQHIELVVIAPDGSRQKLTVTSGDYSINALYGDANLMWAMPDPRDVPKIDITRVSTAPQNRSAVQNFGANPNLGGGQSPIRFPQGRAPQPAGQRWTRRQ